MYCDKNELSGLIREAQGGAVPDRLIELVYLIADGVAGRYRLVTERDDYRQECVVRFLRELPKIDTEREPFGYLSQMCRWVILEHGHDARKEAEGVERFKRDYKPDSGMSVDRSEQYRALRAVPKPVVPEVPKPAEAKVVKVPKPKPALKQRARDPNRVLFRDADYTIWQIAEMLGLANREAYSRLRAADWDAERAFGHMPKP